MESRMMPISDVLFRDLENIEESAGDDFRVQCAMFGGLGETLQWRVWSRAQGRDLSGDPSCDLVTQAVRLFTRVLHKASLPSVSFFSQH